MTITDILNNILGIKDEIKTAIEAAMVTVGDSPFSDYPSLIRSIGADTPESYFIFDDDTQTIIGYNGGIFVDDDPVVPTEGDGQFSGGYGTEESPYIVATVDDLENVTSYPTAHFLQTRDIDLAQYDSNGGCWLGICDYNTLFTGVYDGGNFAILNMHTIDSDGDMPGGLFNAVGNGTVKNVKLVNPHGDFQYDGWNCSGLFASIAEESTFENCHVIRGTIIHGKSGYGSAGFTGYDWLASYTDCSVDLVTTDLYDYAPGDVAGFTSNSYDSTYLRCHVNFIFNLPYGRASGSGGFIGLVSGIFDIQQCSATGSINGKYTAYDTGGFFGRVENGNDDGDITTVKNCWADVDIISEDEIDPADADSLSVGGFVGYWTSYRVTTFNISECAASGSITNNSSCTDVDEFFFGDAFLGMVANDSWRGPSTINVSKCYYDGTKNTDTSTLVTSKTTAEMAQEATFVDWDFVDIWDITDSYPFLVFTFDNEYEITYGLKDVKIPPTIRSLDVLNIGFGAFRSKKLTSVTFPSTVVNIAEFAFYDNDLSEFTNPVDITSIGNNAFYRNSLEAVDLTAGVQSVGNHAFRMNLTLSDITFGTQITTIGEQAFGGTIVTELSISGTSGLVLGYGAFMPNELLASVTIDAQEIGNYAFAASVIETLTLGEGLVTIGDNAFYGSSITTLSIPLSVETIGDMAFTENLIESLAISGSHALKSIGDSAFSNNALTSVTFYEKSVVIGYGAFSVNSINTLTLGTISDIGSNAFYRNLLTVLPEFPEALTTLNSRVFGRNLITAVDLFSVNVIGYYAFESQDIIDIKIGANVSLQTTSMGTWASAFASYYNYQHKAAGRYQRISGSWTKTE